MNLLVVDAKGGGVGKALIEKLREKEINIHIIAVGTNAIATSAMLKAGADDGATGENSVVVCAKEADIIAGPMGIICPNAMLGEITTTIASTIAGSDAKKVLIPFSKSGITVVGTPKLSMTKYIELAVEEIGKDCA